MPLLRTFRFRVQLFRSATAEAGNATAAAPFVGASGTALGDGGFQECSGLEIDMDIQEYEEGGRNDGIIQRVGRAKYGPITLKRGMFYSGGGVNRDLWEWLQNVVGGRRPVARYNGLIEVMGAGEDVVATWEFERGLPKRVAGPQLNGQSGEVAIEELVIAHEGLRLVGG